MCPIGQDCQGLEDARRQFVEGFGGEDESGTVEKVTDVAHVMTEQVQVIAVEGGDVVLAERAKHGAHVFIGLIADLTETVCDLPTFADFDAGEFSKHQIALPHLPDQIGETFVEDSVLRYSLEPHALLLPGARSRRTNVHVASIVLCRTL